MMNSPHPVKPFRLVYIYCKFRARDCGNNSNTYLDRFLQQERRFSMNCACRSRLGSTGPGVSVIDVGGQYLRTEGGGSSCWLLVNDGTDGGQRTEIRGQQKTKIRRQRRRCQINDKQQTTADKEKDDGKDDGGRPVTVLLPRRTRRARRNGGGQKSESSDRLTANNTITLVLPFGPVPLCSHFSGGINQRAMMLVLQYNATFSRLKAILVWKRPVKCGTPVTSWPRIR